MRFRPGLKFRLMVPFLSFAFFFMYLAHKNPIVVPVTDDWLYLREGSNTVGFIKKSNFELITGHQQFLTKLAIWVFAFLPGNYVQNIFLVNVLFATLGFYFLIVSQFAQFSRSVHIVHLFVAVSIACNFKPLYLYMTATGLGLCQAIFFIGIYYLARNMDNTYFSRILILVAIFLAPFTTGLGLVVPISHFFALIWELKQGGFKRIIKQLTDVSVILFGLFFAYFLPASLGILNPRSPQNSAEDVSSILTLITKPLQSVLFIFGLIGNSLLPSSRYDPYGPIIAGVIFLAVFFILLMRLSSFKNLFQEVLINQNPMLSGIIFIVLIVLFRSNSGPNSLNDSAAPRYVFGATLLLLGMYVYVYRSYASNHNKLDRKLFIVFCIILLATTSGLKTGLEWLNVRSDQSKAVFDCITNNSNLTSRCITIASVIREAESTDPQLLSDLQKFTFYLKSREIENYN